MWNISRDRSRSEIKSCNPKNQMWDNPEKWYLSQSGCGIKSGWRQVLRGAPLGALIQGQHQEGTLRLL